MLVVESHIFHRNIFQLIATNDQTKLVYYFQLEFNKVFHQVVIF